MHITSLTCRMKLLWICYQVTIFWGCLLISELSAKFCSLPNSFSLFLTLKILPASPVSAPQNQNLLPTYFLRETVPYLNVKIEGGKENVPLCASP